MIFVLVDCISSIKATAYRSGVANGGWEAQWCELVQSMCWNIIKNPQNLTITIRGAGLGVALHCFTRCYRICERGSYMKSYCWYWFILKSWRFCHLLLILMSIQTQFCYCRRTQNETSRLPLHTHWGGNEKKKRHHERSINFVESFL